MIDPERRSAAAWTLFALTSAFVLVMALIPNPPDVPGGPSDKVQHMIAFAVLAVMAAHAWPKASLLRLAVALSAFGGFIELLQAIPALHRDSDVIDWVADTVAAGLVLLAIGAWRSVRR